MVFPDLNHIEHRTNPKYKALAPIRVLSFVIDYFIFAPVISFLVLVFFHSGVDIYRAFPSSSEAQSVFGTLAVAFLVLGTFFQTLFISFIGATPGQYFLKLKIEFKNTQYPIFLQAWARQLGFVISMIFLGIPFLRVLADENGQCFYEKMTESRVVSMWPIDKNSYFYRTIDLDRKFWSASMATVSTFLIFLGLVMFWKNYQYILTAPETYAKVKAKKKSCTEFVHMDSTERLRFAIAMNLVGTLSDTCLDQEADFVLWRNFTDDRSLAYFAKFVSTTQDHLEAKYLKQACTEDQDTEGCYWAQTFVKNNYAAIKDNHEMASTVLGKVLIYEFMSDTLAKKKTAFNELKSYDEFKSVKKYLLFEELGGTNGSTGRRPASAESLDPEKLLNDEEIKTLIEDL